jgi:hypothetical protein
LVRGRARREAQAVGKGGVTVQTAGNVEIITRFEDAFRAGDQATTDTLCDPGLVERPTRWDHGRPVWALVRVQSMCI